jgi:hypothetical protein
MNGSRSGAGRRPSGVDRAAPLQSAIGRMLGYWAGQSTDPRRAVEDLSFGSGPPPNLSRSSPDRTAIAATLPWPPSAEATPAHIAGHDAWFVLPFAKSPVRNGSMPSGRISPDHQTMLHLLRPNPRPEAMCWLPMSPPADARRIVLIR